MRLIHTILFFLRESSLLQDLARAEKCLKSLEKSTNKTVIILNQGFWDNAQLQNYLNSFQLDCIIIGTGVNVGIVAGRQICFEYIWHNFSNNSFVSELHLDMVFTNHWEDALIDYLNAHDEPVISSGIVEKNGEISCLNITVLPPPDNPDCMDDYLTQLKKDIIVQGFTHPCIHKLDILKEVGGIDTRFLKGKQAFEDDSLLLGYYYYYGVRTDWKPKVNYQTVVYHEIGGQRHGVNNDVMINFDGLVKQYGAMGIKHLANLHTNNWSVNFFKTRFNLLL